MKNPIDLFLQSFFVDREWIFGRKHKTLSCIRTYYYILSRPFWKCCVKLYSFRQNMTKVKLKEMKIMELDSERVIKCLKQKSYWSYVVSLCFVKILLELIRVFFLSYFKQPFVINYFCLIFFFT